MLIAQFAIVVQLLAPPQCQPALDAPALDHAIVVVRDLDAAADAFRRAGFRIKAGRLHANGLLNRHIKFRDGTEIELMTVRGNPRDSMARDYAHLMRQGEGGVYVALRVADLGSVQRSVATQRLTARQSSSGAWRFLSFSEASPLAAVFFTSGDAAISDADSTFRHAPPVDRMVEVWVEGGSELTTLLGMLGAGNCGPTSGPDGRAGQRYALRRGSIVVVPARIESRPHVLGVVLDTPASPPALARPFAQFWIQYR